LAASLLALCVLAWPLSGPSSAEPATAYAQSKKAKAKTKKSTPAPKPVTQAPPLPRTPFTAEEQVAAAIPGIPDARIWGDSAKEFQRVLPEVRGPWIALSGGGADGAYGAGLLTGWTQSGNRPEFATVTGASIGALVSPYVFLGPRYDEEMRSAILSITGADVFEDRSTRESFLDSWPLKRLIEKRVTPELLAAIAAEHKKGRRLLVVTTNVDAGRRMIWNMGAIAAKGDEQALRLFRDVLLASASIPGFFPPVFIEVEANGRKFQEMHLDGSITAPFFVAPESVLNGSAGMRLPATELYIVVNQKLSPDFGPPERTTFSILSRLIGVVLKTGLQAEVMLVAASAERLGVPLMVAQVPDSFQVQARGLFDEAYMKALFELGTERIKNGDAFQKIGMRTPDLRTGTAQ
jgi:hypothetical protein